jgi:hypothetical protein
MAHALYGAHVGPSDSCAPICAHVAGDWAVFSLTAILKGCAAWVLFGIPLAGVLHGIVCKRVEPDWIVHT